MQHTGYQATKQRSYTLSEKKVPQRYNFVPRGTKNIMVPLKVHNRYLGYNFVPKTSYKGTHFQIQM